MPGGGKDGCGLYGVACDIDLENQTVKYVGQTPANDTKRSCAFFS